MLTTPALPRHAPLNPNTPMHSAHPHPTQLLTHNMPRRLFPGWGLELFTCKGTRSQHQDLEFLPEGAANLLDSTLHTQVLTQTLNVEQGHKIILINQKQSPKFVTAAPV